MNDSLHLLDATAQAQLVYRGEVTPLELVDAAIARIEAHDPALNSVIWRQFAWIVAPPCTRGLSVTRGPRARQTPRKARAPGATA